VLIGVLQPAEADALPAPVSIVATMMRIPSGARANLRIIKQFLWVGRKVDRDRNRLESR
jgi:hypothetical protein